MIQACAESKVKCNLQFPCSKCTSRGKECIFVNDPEASRLKRNAAKRASQRASSSKASADFSASSSPLTVNHPPPLDSSSTASSSSSLPTSPTLHAFPPSFSCMSHVTLDAFDMFPQSSSTGSSSSSSGSSPRSDLFDRRHDTTGGYAYVGLDTLTLDTQLNRLFSDAMFDSPVDNHFPSCSPPQDAYSWIEGNEFYPNLSDAPFPFNQQVDDQAFLAPLELGTLTYRSGLSAASPLSSLACNIGNLPAEMSHNPEPVAAELDHYRALLSESHRRCKLI